MGIFLFEIHQVSVEKRAGSRRRRRETKEEQRDNQPKILIVPSAPELATNLREWKGLKAGELGLLEGLRWTGRREEEEERLEEGWNLTSSTPSWLDLYRWDEISWRQVREPVRSQNRIEQSCPPDTRIRPVGSIDSEVTESRWPSIECVHAPDHLVHSQLFPPSHVSSHF